MITPRSPASRVTIHLHSLIESAALTKKTTKKAHHETSLTLTVTARNTPGKSNTITLET